MLLTARRLRKALTLAPAAFWLWKERHVLAGMLGFARTVPDRVKLGRAGEVGLATKVHWALLRDDRLKGADIRVGAVSSGDVCLEVGRGAEAAGEAARRLVESIPGVTSVRLEGCDPVVAPSAGTAERVAVAGAADVAADVDAIAGLDVRV